MFDSEKNLKPCPFCKGTNLAVMTYPEQENESYVYFSKRYAVQCIYSELNTGCGSESGHFKSEGEAIERWNTRL